MTRYELLTWTPDMVRRYWDYESQFSDNFFTYRNKREIIRVIKPYLTNGANVLDYGCGPGNLTGSLLDEGFRVAGLDTSGSARDQVRQRFSGAPNFLGVFDQEEIGRAGLRFDAIVVAEVIEHLYDEQLDELLGTLKSLSTPATRIIFTTPNEEVLEDSYILCPVSGKLFHRWQHVRSWSRESLTSYLQSRDFDVNAVFATDFGISLRPGTGRKRMREVRKGLRKLIKYRLNSGKKRPHLVAVATLAAR